jgi:hypothetical protein
VSAQDDVLAAFGAPRAASTAKAEAGEAELGEASAAGQAASGELAGAQAAEERGGEAEPGDDSAAEHDHASAPEQTTDAAPATASQAAEPGQASASQAEPGPAPASEAETAPAPAGATASQAAEPGRAPASQTEPAPTPAADQVTPAGPSPAALTQPYLDPAAFFAQLQAEAAPKPPRRWPRLVLRYAAAVVVAGAVGAGSAYAVTLPRRTDVPFLATPSDGRYAFPFVVKPAPPAGEPAPGADDNNAQIHYDDLRQYLLPAPSGAAVKEDGWEPVADFEASMSGSDVAGRLSDAGLRHVARRGWRAPDGQHTVVELLQFPDHQAAYSVESMLDSATPAKAGRAESVVPTVTLASFGDETVTVAVHKFDQVDGLPGQIERRVVFQSGDVVAIVTTTAPGKVPDTPTEQVVMLQAQMLR